MRTLLCASIFASACHVLPVHAISVSPTADSFALANTLFLNLPGLQVTGATLSGSYGQAGVYTNLSGTYGLPNSGILLSSGDVADYGDGIDSINGFSTEFGNPATVEQQDLLEPITGQGVHNDVVQLDISFNVGVNVSQVSFFGAFGSEEFPDFVGSYVDGFGLYVNGVNVAGVQPTGGGPNLPVNIDHPDMDPSIGGTELNAMLAPNGNPVLRFDVPVNPGQINDFQIILGDANDSALDTTVYLSSFFAQGGTGGGNPNPSEEGTTEFNPVLPSNPPDPTTGEFIVVVDAAANQNVWIDPPVTTGYVYDAGTNEFATITAPSLATVADIDGYLVTVGGVTVSLAAGATLDFLATFGVTPTSFTLSDINPSLSLDPSDTAAFPLGVSFTTALSAAEISIAPVVTNTTPGTSPVPLPASGLLLLCSLTTVGLARRRLTRR